MNSSSPLETGLARPCRFLKGVGPRRADDLTRLGIETVGDLLLHFPRTYLDLGDPTPLGQLPGEGRVTVRGTILASGERRPRRGMSILSVLIGDDSGRLKLVFFNQPFLRKQMKNGVELIVSGELNRFQGEVQITSPEFEFIDDDSRESSVFDCPLVPVYPLTRGVGQRWLRRLIHGVLQTPSIVAEIAEILPAEWLKQDSWPGREEAIGWVHYPADQHQLQRALTRLKFDELFLLQLMGAMRRSRLQVESGTRLKGDGPAWRGFMKALPFKLTGAQERVLGEVSEQLAQGERLNLLLQGDVGSGKTVVALAALLQAVDGGHQAAFMVPLEVLAQQHWSRWAEPLGELGVRTALLTGGTKAAERRQILKDLAAGDIHLLFGTQALIQDGVEFRRPGVAVVDEQHRFGVMQRLALARKGFPHMLVMSATPIPRSLAMTLYGDLDLAVIDELPPGRPPVVSRLTDETRLPQVYEFLVGKLRDGERAFLIFPLVEEGDKRELKAVTEEFEILKEGEFKEFSCDMVHGRMSATRKTEALEGFREGRTRLLLATTVIEVGIDIPEATVMVIHNPERFGLSQLHQLRGRIGRGTIKSYCILVAPGGMGDGTRRRLEIFVRNRDGFKLAEEDLLQRGPGEIFGLRQHGSPELTLAHPIHDADLVTLARERAESLVAGDPELMAADMQVLRVLLSRFYGERIAISGIG